MKQLTTLAASVGLMVMLLLSSCSLKFAIHLSTDLKAPAADQEKIEVDKKDGTGDKNHLKIIANKKETTMDANPAEIDLTKKKASDDVLILKALATKTTRFSLPKKLYKTAQRKAALKEIASLSEKALIQYRNKIIDRAKYDEIQTEAIYGVQNAISRMQSEDSIAVTGNDPILDYLNTVIKTLKDFF